MSEEKFLARWSRRKREAAPKTEARSTAPAGGEAAREYSTELPPPEKPLPPAAPEGLPSVDAIDAGTDIRGFLADGVPAALSRAALRRAWVSDPGIRGFIGLSENAWDFTAPDGVPGFGALSAEDIRRLLAHADEAAAAPSKTEPNAPIAEDVAPSKEIADVSAEGREPPTESTPSATANTSGTEVASSPPACRHGGALPQ